jgi:transcriptional regulator with XRE-family HTH domain
VNNVPYKILGGQLKHLRQNRAESLEEVSGAVEIATETLKKIEGGFVRPTEDILMLMINHFGMKDDEAVQLWELAGYNKRAQQKGPTEEDIQKRAVFIMMTLDTRILYSDCVHITANLNGIVLNFTQGSIDQNNQPQSVARVGMSYEQAQIVTNLLQQTLINRTNANKHQNTLPATGTSQTSSQQKSKDSKSK